jgi:hypothetical protein
MYGLTRLGLKPAIYRTRGEHANHDATDAVRVVLHAYVYKHIFLINNLDMTDMHYAIVIIVFCLF